jgi:hypothetical protein
MEIFRDTIAIIELQAEVQGIYMIFFFSIVDIK